MATKGKGQQTEWRGRKVTLRRPRKIKGVTPAKKKYTVFVRDKNGKIRVVHFGAVGYSDFLKHKNKKRRANFKARHNCSTAKDPTTPRYWACRHNW